jgi:hypothetical protein
MTKKEIAQVIEQHREKVASGFSESGIASRYKNPRRKGLKHQPFAADFKNRFSFGDKVSGDELDRFIREFAPQKLRCCENKMPDESGHRTCTPNDDSWTQHIQNRNGARSHINIGAVADTQSPEDQFQLDCDEYNLYVVVPIIDGFDDSIARLGKRVYSFLQTQYENIDRRRPIASTFDLNNPADLLTKNAVEGHLNALQDAGRQIKTTISNMESQILASKKLLKLAEEMATMLPPSMGSPTYPTTGNLTDARRYLEGISQLAEPEES